jgi:hypothetical protein
MIQKIVRIPLRSAFPHEAYDFTRWLQDNLDVLNECTGLTLSGADREAAAGDFSVDLVAENESGGKVIIENQIGKSNHDHLGKLLTYLVAIEAKAAIWVVSEPRPEHISAITWLNESASSDFYVVKLEAIRIGESDPAPLLTLIVGPSDATKAAGQAKQNFELRHDSRREYWTRLLEVAKARTKLHAGCSPGRYAWLGAGAGKRGLTYNYDVWEHESGVGLYIDRRKGAEAENKLIFDALVQHRDQIESAFGGPLDWERLDEKRAARIRKTCAFGGWKDPEKWQEVLLATVDGMIRFEGALRPVIQKLDIESA